MKHEKVDKGTDVGMTCACDVLGAGTVFHGENGFGNHFSSVGACGKLFFSCNESTGAQSSYP